jgi:hypothetical protein
MSSTIALAGIISFIKPRDLTDQERAVLHITRCHHRYAHTAHHLRQPSHPSLNNGILYIE